MKLLNLLQNRIFLSLLYFILLVLSLWGLPIIFVIFALCSWFHPCAGCIMALGTHVLAVSLAPPPQMCILDTITCETVPHGIPAHQD